MAKKQKQKTIVENFNLNLIEQLNDQIKRQQLEINDQAVTINNLNTDNRWYAGEIDAMKEANAKEVAIHREVITQLLKSYRYTGRRTVWTNERGEEIAVKVAPVVDRSVQNNATGYAKGG